MRCITCGKWFQSANAKEVTCPDCTQKARKEKLAAKNAPQPPTKSLGTSGPAQRPAPGGSRPLPSPKPKPASTGTNHWLDTYQDVKVVQPEQPRRPLSSSPGPVPRENSGHEPPNYRDRQPNYKREDNGPRGPYRDPRENKFRGSSSPYDERQHQPGPYREKEQEQRGPGNYRSPGSYRSPGNYTVPGSVGERPRLPQQREGTFSRYQRPDQRRPGIPDAPTGFRKPAKPTRPPRQAQPPKPKKEKTPPPPPFTPTPEQITQVEMRYQELATPQEFDGIRTQIAHELNIPRKAVKKIVKEFRSREHVPSWWEIQSYKGNDEELEKIKAAYRPYLPVPPIGVHKLIADSLSLKAGVVYQAIKSIRQDLKLPQYNNPDLREQEDSSLVKTTTTPVDKGTSSLSPVSEGQQLNDPSTPVDASNTAKQPAQTESEQHSQSTSPTTLQEPVSATPIDGQEHLEK